jgi:hypothetical protein
MAMATGRYLSGLDLGPQNPLELPVWDPLSSCDLPKLGERNSARRSSLPSSSGEEKPQPHPVPSPQAYLYNGETRIIGKEYSSATMSY